MRWTTGCRQREAGNRFIKEFVWNKRTIRSSWCQIMIDRLYASCIFNSIKRKFLHLQGWLFLLSLWGMVSATEREKSFSFTLPLVVFTVVRLEGFPEWFSSFSNPSAVGHWTVHHLERHALESSTLERILFSRDLMFACVFFRTWTAPLFDLRIFCMRAGLADGHRLDIHAVLNGTKLDTCCSFLRHGKFWEPSISFCWGPFCAPFALLFFSSFGLWLSPSLVGFSLYLLPPTFLSAFVISPPLSSVFAPSPPAAIRLSFWLRSLNPLTHWVLHACKGWC